MFETNLRDERFLPFEGAGAISTWRLTLPTPVRDFDYQTITDVVLHIRYTARPGGNQLAAQATKELATDLSPPPSGQSNGSTTISQGLLLSLRHDFPTEWAAYIDSATTDPNAAFKATLSPQRFPYAVQYAFHMAKPGATDTLQIDSGTLYKGVTGATGPTVSPAPFADITTIENELNDAESGPPRQATLILPDSQYQNILQPNGSPDRNQEVYLVLQYNFRV